jgi:glutathione S-transferase
VIRLYRFRSSTNVERVTLALAHKGLEIESVWVDPDDRGPVEWVSQHGLSR